jgi:hypothetical protein
METKNKLLLLVLSISLSGILFTSCVKNEESDGVRAVREGYAAKLAGDADYQKALAEKARAEAEYIRLQAQWEKEEAAARVELAKVQIELEKVMLEYQKNLNDLEIAEKKAQLEVTLQIQKNLLLDAQHAYALAIINNEKALIEAQKALDKAKADLLAFDPNLEAYLELSDKLYNAMNGIYYQRLDKITEKLGLEAELLELQYAVNADQRAWLQRDAAKADEALKYTQALLKKYEDLDGLSVAALQAKADEAGIEWKKAQAAAQELEVVKQEKTNTITEEGQKLSVETTKLNGIKSQLTNGATLNYEVQEEVVDSLYNTHLPKGSPEVYPAPQANLVNPASTYYAGAQNILNYANIRLAYLQSASAASQLYEPGKSTVPGDAYPTKKYLEDRIAHITNNLLPSVATQIADQEAIIATQQEKFNEGKAEWDNAKTEYLTAVEDFNAITAALRNQLNTWQTVTDAMKAPSSTVTELNSTQKTNIFIAVKAYYVMRYNFDRKTATGYSIPTTLTELNNVAFSRDALFGSISDNATSYQTAIDAFKTETDVRIRNNYEWRNYDDNSAAANPATVQVTFSTGSLPSGPTVYQRSRIGLYLYYSATVYGASTITDVHYYLPYDKRPEEKAPGVPSAPLLGNYNSSIFYNLDEAKTALTELEANNANSFYLENYKTMLAIVNRTIAYYSGIKTAYEAKIIEISNQVKAQQTVVDAQLAVVKAANIALDVATIEYNAAETYAGSLQNIYDQLKDADNNTLAVIKAKIAELESEIGDPTSGLIKQVADAQKALRDYEAKGDESDYIARLIAEKEAKKAALEAQISALNTLIAEIEAKLEELLK